MLLIKLSNDAVKALKKKYPHLTAGKAIRAMLGLKIQKYRTYKEIYELKPGQIAFFDWTQKAEIYHLKNAILKAQKKYNMKLTLITNPLVIYVKRVK